MNRSTFHHLYEKYLCPEGRMKRKLFIVNFFITFAMITAFQIATALFLIILGTVLSFVDPGLLMALEYGDSMGLGIAYILLNFLATIPTYIGFYVILRAAMRRWHDIGHSDIKFGIYFYILPVALWIASLGILFFYSILKGSSFGMMRMENSSLELFLGASILITFLYVFGMFLYLCIRGSEPADNAYGTVEGGYHMQPEIRTRPREDVSIWSAIFRTEGRLNRKRFIFGLLAVSLIHILAWIVFFSLLFLPSDTVLGVIFVPSIIVFVCLIFLLPMGLYMQRLQDLGKSPLLWSIPTVLAAIAFAALFISAHNASPNPMHELNGYTITMIISLVYHIVYALYATVLGVYVFFAPGEEGENEYGENPLVPVEAVTGGENEEISASV